MRLEELYRTYCGLNAEQADALRLLYIGQVIHPNRLRAFIENGLVKKDQGAHVMTMDGLFVLARVQSIKNLVFTPLDPSFLPAELDALWNHVTRLARASLPMSMGMRSAHIKGLVSVAQRPGIVRNVLASNFGDDVINFLDNQRLIGCSEPHMSRASRHSPWHVEMQGLSMLKWLLNETGMEGV